MFDESSLNDMKAIKKTLTPYMKKLEKQGVDTFSVIFFFSSYIRELLKEVDDEDKYKEMVIRLIFD